MSPMDAQIITNAALDVLDDVGLDKLSMRLVATRLGVQVGGLYYYVADKAALLRAMADELCQQVLSEAGPGQRGSRARVPCRAHRGGRCGRVRRLSCARC